MSILSNPQSSALLFSFNFLYIFTVKSHFVMCAETCDPDNNNNILYSHDFIVINNRDTITAKTVLV